jgi:hypothetical protein
MGCAGSKPHLPSLSSNHINSPQKGFILFNAKTIEERLQLAAIYSATSSLLSEPLTNRTGSEIRRERREKQKQRDRSNKGRARTEQGTKRWSSRQKARKTRKRILFSRQQKINKALIEKGAKKPPKIVLKKNPQKSAIFWQNWRKSCQRNRNFIW